MSGRLEGRVALISGLITGANLVIDGGWSTVLPGQPQEVSG